MQIVLWLNSRSMANKDAIHIHTLCMWHIATYMRLLTSTTVHCKLTTHMGVLIHIHTNHF